MSLPAHIRKAPGQKWKDVSDVPEMAFQNAGFALRSMHATGLPTPLTNDDLLTLMVAIREFVPAVGTYLDGE